MFHCLRRLRAFRRRYGLCGLLQIHHIIPRSMSDSLAGSGIHINDPRNLMFMPTRLGARRMRVRSERLLHDGGHPAYNAHVAVKLEHATNLTSLMDDLRMNLSRADPELPWP